jgi:tetratricopeptide (TPR) repeat protein
MIRYFICIIGYLLLCLGTQTYAVVDAESLFQEANSHFYAKRFSEAVALYKKAIAIDDRSAELFYNLGVTYYELKDYTAAIAALNEALKRHSSHARAELYLGKIALAQGDKGEAQKHFTHALSDDPKLRDAVYPLAELLKEDLLCEEALVYLRAAVKHHPNDPMLLFTLANTLNMADYTEEALDIYLYLNEKHPNDSGIVYNIAYTYKKLGDADTAFKYYDRTLELNPEHSEALFSQGLAFLSVGDWERGWEGYEHRWSRNDHQKLRNYPEPLWRGEDLHNKHIYIYGEQGLGDTFQFARYFKILKEKYGVTKISFSPQKQLMDIMALCPYIDEVLPFSRRPEHFDYCIPLLSLPYICQTRVYNAPNEIPYLYADPNLVAYWYERLAADKNFKIGICWQGNSEYGTAFLRAAVAGKSMHVSLFEPFTRIPGVTVYSLQRYTGIDQLKELPPTMQLKQFGDDFDVEHGRFMDTAAVIKNLDLVITIDTSICHIAAALGIPVWNLLPNPPDWRWMMEGNSTPWYPNMRLFRQKTAGDWQSVITEVVDELKRLLTEKTANQPHPLAHEIATLYAQRARIDDLEVQKMIDAIITTLHAKLSKITALE